MLGRGICICEISPKTLRPLIDSDPSQSFRYQTFRQSPYHPEGAKGGLFGGGASAEVPQKCGFGGSLLGDTRNDDADAC